MFNQPTFTQLIQNGQGLAKENHLWLTTSFACWILFLLPVPKQWDQSIQYLTLFKTNKNYLCNAGLFKRRNSQRTIRYNTRNCHI